MEPYKKQKITSPEEFATAFVSAWNNRDSYEIIELFDESAELENAEGLWKHKNKEFYSAYENGLRFNFKEVKLSLLSAQNKFVTSSIAEVKATIQLQSLPGAKIKIPYQKQIFSFVLQYTVDDWLCIALTVANAKN